MTDAEIAELKATKDEYFLMIMRLTNENAELRASVPQTSNSQAVAEALGLLSDLFSETAHEDWTKEEVAGVIEDFIKIRCPDTRPDRKCK
jgi:hypothetical protein